MRKNVAALTLLVVLSFTAVQARSNQPQSSSGDQTSSAPEEKLRQDSSGVTPGLLIKRVNPQYPKDARKKHVTGKVLLQGTITKRGNVVGLSVISGDPLLAEAALKAVKQWKYKPYLFQGKPVDVETKIIVTFDYF